MHSIAGKSGVYQILCVPTGKVYIGSAVNLAHRWQEHRWALRRGKHHSRHLQHAWDKYGETAFEFSVLELVPMQNLLEAEQRWIELTRCCEREQGFNICQIAGSALGIKRSDITRQKMSAALGRSHIGFIDPNGNPVVIDNMQRFCREHDLNPDLMYRLAKQKSRHHSYKGWTFIGNINRQIRQYERFISPSGEITTIINLSRFCRENNLIQAHMLALYNGGRLSHKGWTHIDSLHKRKRTKYEGFISPQGEPVAPIENMEQFCLDHGLRPNHMYLVYHGKRCQHKGWTCIRVKDKIDE